MDRIAEPHTYDDVVTAEVATEVVNSAIATIMPRIYAVEAQDPAEAERLRAKHRELHTLRGTIQVSDPEGARAITSYWGPLVKDEAAFWRVVNGQ